MKLEVPATRSHKPQQKSSHAHKTPKPQTLNSLRPSVLELTCNLKRTRILHKVHKPLNLEFNLPNPNPWTNPTKQYSEIHARLQCMLDTTYKGHFNKAYICTLRPILYMYYIGLYRYMDALTLNLNSYTALVEPWWCRCRCITCEVYLQPYRNPVKPHKAHIKLHENSMKPFSSSILNPKSPNTSKTSSKTLPKRPFKGSRSLNPNPTMLKQPLQNPTKTSYSPQPKKTNPASR